LMGRGERPVGSGGTRTSMPSKSTSRGKRAVWVEKKGVSLSKRGNVGTTKRGAPNSDRPVTTLPTSPEHASLGRSDSTARPTSVDNIESAAIEVQELGPAVPASPIVDYDIDDHSADTTSFDMELDMVPLPAIPITPERAVPRPSVRYSRPRR
jgi:hypothetical protein